MSEAPTPCRSSGGDQVGGRARRELVLLAIFVGLLARELTAQAAIDPNVAPRAEALERAGERQMAIDLLGRYLATAPDDGHAWFQLGRLYLYDAREWHLRGHRGDPDGLLYLDFAATALDQSVRLAVDSGALFRGLAELERWILVLEDSGWTAGGITRLPAEAPPLPSFVLELGGNLVGSCPRGGVLLTGTDLEALSAWYGGSQAADSRVVLVRPDLYVTDSLYRRRVSEAIGVDPALPVRAALEAAAARRPICLAPGADSAAAPPLGWVPFRLVRVSVETRAGAGEALSIVELLRAARQDQSPWVREVRGVYERAALHNTLLCSSLLPVFGDDPPAACKP